MTIRSVTTETIPEPITTRRPLDSPDTFDPAGATGMLPAPTGKDLIALRDAGWARLGIVAAIIDDRDDLLVLDHRPNDKIPVRSLGPLAETTQASYHAAGWHIETSGQTLARGIAEELGIADPDSLKLHARALGAWTINAWPVGGKYEQSVALAVCPLLRISTAGREALLDTFQPTSEIEAVRFIAPADLAHERAIRPGTVTWLGDVMASMTIPTPITACTPLNLPRTPIPGTPQDVRFDRMIL